MGHARPGSVTAVTLRRLITLFSLAAVVAAALVSIGARESAEADARRTAERVLHQIAHAVLVTLAAQDYRAAGGVERSALLAEMSPYLRSGIVYRVKVWTVRADQLEIVFCDEHRVEGERERLGADLAATLAAGEVLVQPVPDDHEHRFEIAEGGRLLEAFIGFRDAGGHPAILEIYVPVAVAEDTQGTTAVVLPLALLGLALLGLALIPIAVALARRIDRTRRERQDALHYGLAAGELTRRELARKLHDDVLPDLTSAGLLLDAAGRDRGGPDLLERARVLVTHVVAQLRTLLGDLATPPPPGGDLRETFTDLAVRFRGPDREIGVDVADDLDIGDDAVVLLLRAAGELLRNAVGHGKGDRVAIRVTVRTAGRVTLTVSDNGAGFRPDRPVRQGHIGLLLIRRVVDDVDGRMSVASTPGEGTTVTIDVPADLRLPRPDRPPTTGSPPY